MIKNFRFSFFIILATFIVSCSDDIASIDDNKLTVQQQAMLQEQGDKIRQAYEHGLIVSDITYIDNASRDIDDEKGWLITFSDGTTEKLIDVEKCATPYLKMDAEGHWMVSFDTKSFQYLLDENREKVKASLGDNSETGYSIRAGFDEEGYHIFEIFDIKNPTAYSVFIEPKVSVSDRTAIRSILRDDKAGVVIITVADGTPYKFRLQNSIGTLTVLSENLFFRQSGDTLKMSIIVEPGNFLFNYNITDPECDITLQYVNGNRALNNGTFPVKIVGIEPLKNSAGTVLEGYYTVTLTDTGDNLLTYNEEAYLTLQNGGTSGEKTAINSNLFNVSFLSNFPMIQRTGLPVVIINTPAPITSKEIWTSGVTMTIYNPDGTIDFDGTLQMKGRGNSTWGYVKKPYALKLDSKSKILGMKKHKRWCLLANYIDRTLMRNAVAFEISKKTSLDWTPSGQWVDLILNGEFYGNYYLCEQIKVDENRVNVTELDANAMEGEAITGGYLFEVDTNFDEAFKFRSASFNFPWMFKDPDEVNTAQFNYGRNYVNSMEAAIRSIAWGDYSSYKEYLDIESCIDWWFVQELMTCWEGEHPKSVYFSKDLNGKMKMGPVWDYDWATLVQTSYTSFCATNHIYFRYLFQDPTFLALVKERWSKYYDSLLSIPIFIDKNAQHLIESDKLNYAKWGYFSYPNNESLDYLTAVDRIKRAFLAKLEYMNATIPNL